MHVAPTSDNDFATTGTAADETYSADLATLRAADDFHQLTAEMLASEVAELRKAEQALRDAQEGMRLRAAKAVRSGFGRKATADALGISRPTLNAWVGYVESEPDLMSLIEREERQWVRIERRAGRL